MWLEIKTDLMWWWWWVVVVVGVEGENRNKLGACQYVPNSTAKYIPHQQW